MNGATAPSPPCRWPRSATSASGSSPPSDPAINVVAHSDIAPDRKQDPGELFDWEGLAANGVGLWPHGWTRHDGRSRRGPMRDARCSPRSAIAGPAARRPAPPSSGTGGRSGWMAWRMPRPSPAARRRQLMRALDRALITGPRDLQRLRRRLTRRAGPAHDTAASGGQTTAGPRCKAGLEESPGSTGKRCRLTAGGGDLRESATESRPPARTRSQGGLRVRVKGCGKSAPRPWQQGRHGKPHREQGRIGVVGGVPSGA